MGAYEVLACERVLRGALAAGQEREGELATTTLEFEYLHGRCEMLIGRDNISNDVITLGTCFSVFFYVRTLFRFELIAWGQSDSSVDGEPQGNWRWNSNSSWLAPVRNAFSPPSNDA